MAVFAAFQNTSSYLVDTRHTGFPDLHKIYWLEPHFIVLLCRTHVLYCIPNFFEWCYNTSVANTHYLSNIFHSQTAIPDEREIFFIFSQNAPIRHGDLYAFEFQTVNTKFNLYSGKTTHHKHFGEYCGDLFDQCLLNYAKRRGTTNNPNLCNDVSFRSNLSLSLCKEEGSSQLIKICSLSHLTPCQLPQW